MDSAFGEAQPVPDRMGSIDPLDTYFDFGTYNHSTRSEEHLGSPLSGLLQDFSGQPEWSSTAGQICHRVAGNGDVDESFCFCNGCLTKQCPTAKDADPASSLEPFGSASKTTTSMASNSVSAVSHLFSLPVASAPSSSRTPVQPRSPRRSINKPRTQSETPHSKELVIQLEAMIQDDTKASAEFKWHTSILFRELKRLIDSEHSARRQPIPRKKKARKVETSPKIFQCTALPCEKSSAYPLGWKRHEETHWPQSRYMCLDCPVSTPDVDFPDALQCLFCSVLSLSLEDLHLHLLTLCNSAKEKGRVFIRKDKLIKHLQEIHSTTPGAASDQAERWKYDISSNWPRSCGFCHALFTTWDQRAEHLVEEHFKKGANMTMWQSFTPRTEKDRPTASRNSISAGSCSENTPLQGDINPDIGHAKMFELRSHEPQLSNPSDSHDLLEKLRARPPRSGLSSKYFLEQTSSPTRATKYSEYTRDTSISQLKIEPHEHSCKGCCTYCKEAILAAEKKTDPQADASLQPELELLSGMSNLSLDNSSHAGHGSFTPKSTSEENPHKTEKKDPIQRHRGDLPCSFAVLGCKKRFRVTNSKQWLFHDFSHFQRLSYRSRVERCHLDCPECGERFGFQFQRSFIMFGLRREIWPTNLRTWVRRSLHIAMHTEMDEMPPDYCLLRLLASSDMLEKPLIDPGRIFQHLQRVKNQDKQIKVEHADIDYGRKEPLPIAYSWIQKVNPDRLDKDETFMHLEQDYYDWKKSHRGARWRRRVEEEGEEALYEEESEMSGSDGANMRERRKTSGTEFNTAEGVGLGYALEASREKCSGRLMRPNITNL